MTEDEWSLAYLKYHLAALRSKAVMLSPAEDGFICVPLLMVGIGPISAGLAGAVFGILHLGRFTYLECIAKAAIYGLVCYYILPLGLLTVVLGHLMMNMAALVYAQVAHQQLARKLRSNSTVVTDARRARSL